MPTRAWVSRGERHISTKVERAMVVRTVTVLVSLFPLSYRQYGLVFDDVFFSRQWLLTSCITTLFDLTLVSHHTRRTRITLISRA